MKRLEEIFDKTISDYNKRVSHVYAFKFTDSERKMFLEMIQTYAREVAQASLEKAAYNANIKYHDGHNKLYKAVKHVQIGADNIQIDKESITNESNITLL
ncbi:hypothetical protein [Elizabethkingia miricola]|uniref:Uncharacterized protein n=1 Tax=Elizabethkingia miricola TaxID=172045 RepID=A0ABD5B3E3_ELIMR|nr:hypothetical protein [Elizabethkingia miricola]MDQ8748358.1 hypothetical protein [Elizabethkingia miricola]